MRMPMQHGFELMPSTRAAETRSDWRALERDLASAITGEVRFDPGSRALYSTDASNYRQLPIGVVLPKTEEDILNTIKACKKYGAPVLSRGGGTSLAGQCCNVAVVMDMSKYYNKVLNIDKEKKLVTIQPGIVLDEMRHATETNVGLTFGPDPATHSRCTLGGMLGNNSCGVHSIIAGVTADNVESLDVVLYDGTRLTVSRGEDAIRGPGAEQLTTRLHELADRWGDRVRSGFPQIP